MPSEREIFDFWLTAPEWMEITGYSEEEMLERFPSMRGTKPAARSANSNLVSMPRDHKSAAAGDI